MLSHRYDSISSICPNLPQRCIELSQNEITPCRVAETNRSMQKHRALVR